MKRHACQPRSGWRQKLESVGFTYHSHETGPYWDESACYEFTAAEVAVLERAARDLHFLCIDAAEAVIRNGWWDRLAIPPAAVPSIRNSWERDDFSLYGRFDLAYDGNQIKLLEYNADTPTALVEAAVAQWYWLEDQFPKADQWNSIHEKLIAKWKDLKDYVTQPVSFAYVPTTEDEFTVGYLRDTAEQAGLKTQALKMSDIGFDHNTFTFVDLEGKPIKSIFKLYPWEWMLKEQFGARALDFMDKTQWMEPIWKMMFSNKGLLAILWEMYPGNELLLPAYLDGPREMKDYVRKPLLGREGANVQVIRQGEKEQSYGRYGEEGWVYQALAPIACMDGHYPVLGSWMIADQGAAGMGIRESDTIITTNRSRFVPHLFR